MQRGERSGSAWRELEVGSALLVAPRPYAFILVVPPRGRAKEPFAESRRTRACTLCSTSSRPSRGRIINAWPWRDSRRIAIGREFDLVATSDYSPFQINRCDEIRYPVASSSRYPPLTLGRTILRSIDAIVFLFLNSQSWFVQWNDHRRSEGIGERVGRVDPSNMSEERFSRGMRETNDNRDEKFGRKRNTAQRRWRILAKALIGTNEPISADAEDEISVRRFTSFDLLKVTRLANAPPDSDSDWYEYSAALEKKLFTVQIRRINKNFTANELIGFNNTGNVCVWPSEECLAYYLLKNREICRNRRVLELGGGMSCLAGVIAAKYCDPSGVTLTDGNVTSVENVRCIVAKNGMAEFVECGVVQWAKAARAIRAAARPPRTFLHSLPNGLRVKSRTSGGKDAEKLVEKPYDVILCADCLFFDEARSDLVETIYGWLANDGLALVMAPRRASTFQKFAEAAGKRGFIARQIDRYDSKIWSRHLELLEHSQEYCPDLHYPILLELTKQKKTPPG